MTISASDVEVGRCYLTGYSEMRRVIAVDFNDVTYETITNNRPKEVSEPPVLVSREKFAAEVDREVACPD